MHYFSDHRRGAWNKAWAIRATCKTYDGNRTRDYLLYTKSADAEEVQRMFEHDYHAVQIETFQRRYECKYCHTLFPPEAYQAHLAGMTMEASCVQLKPNEKEFFWKQHAEQARHLNEDVI
jgi:hypothetical protein